MRDLTPNTITNAFAEYARNAPSARTRELLVGLAGHLHGFVRENKVTQAEWGAAIDALTRAMKFTDDKRNEYILFSDLLGVSSLVDMVNAATTGTPSSVLGPFHIEGAPELSNGGDLWKGQVGEPLVVSGRIVDARARRRRARCWRPWQNSGNGLYAQQDPDQSPTNYHARLTVAPATAPSPSRPCGRWSCTVPDDGPAGDMLRVLGPPCLAAGASAHDHQGAGTPAADHGILSRGRQVPRPGRRVRRSRRPRAAVQEGDRSRRVARQPRRTQHAADAGVDGDARPEAPAAEVREARHSSFSRRKRPSTRRG